VLAVYELAPLIADIISSHCPGSSARERSLHASIGADWDEARSMIDGMLAEPWHLSARARRSRPYISASPRPWQWPSVCTEPIPRRERRSLREISAELEKAGHVMTSKYRKQMQPRAFNPATIKAMVEGPMAAGAKPATARARARPWPTTAWPRPGPIIAGGLRGLRDRQLAKLRSCWTACARPSALTRLIVRGGPAVDGDLSQLNSQGRSC
jgi:hypothetical protein